jgi:hypothetical protein
MVCVGVSSNLFSSYPSSSELNEYAAAVTVIVANAFIFESLI